MTSSKDEIHYLAIDDFEIIFDQLATAQQEYSEDLPPFNTRYPGRLESIISQYNLRILVKNFIRVLLQKPQFSFI